MNFSEIAQTRQSCRSYNAEKAVEEEKYRLFWKPHGCRPLPVTASLIILLPAVEKLQNSSFGR